MSSFSSSSSTASSAAVASTTSSSVPSDSNDPLKPSPDAIGAAHDQLMRFMKLYADTIWEVQQMRQVDTNNINNLGNRLQTEWKKLQTTISSVPDYQDMVGDDTKFNAQLEEIMKERATISTELSNSISAGERRLANIDAVLAAATKVVLDNHPWPIDESNIGVRSDGSIITSYVQSLDKL